MMTIEYRRASKEFVLMDPEGEEVCRGRNIEDVIHRDVLPVDDVSTITFDFKVV